MMDTPHASDTSSESPGRLAARKGGAPVARSQHPRGRRLFQAAPQGGVAVVLENSELWRRFHRAGTEMIITKTGRRMFPALQVSLSGLDPDAEYSVLLEVTPGAGHHRLRFSGREWLVAGRGEAQAPPGARTYVHPDSPAKGEHWMAATVSFSKVKLTNNSLDGRGHVVLTSMHKYMPRVHVVEASPPLAGPSTRHLSFSFPETEFVAVTAYQNGKITKLKIDHNPFAKGFREGGMSRSKRKLDDEPPEGQEDDGCCHLAAASEDPPSTRVPRRHDNIDLNNNDGREVSGTQEKCHPAASRAGPWVQSPFGQGSPLPGAGPPLYFSPETGGRVARVPDPWPLAYGPMHALLLWASLAQQTTTGLGQGPPAGDSQGIHSAFSPATAPCQMPLRPPFPLPALDAFPLPAKPFPLHAATRPRPPADDPVLLDLSLKRP